MTHSAPTSPRGCLAPRLASHPTPHSPLCCTGGPARHRTDGRRRLALVADISTLPRLTVGEWVFAARHEYENPFTDVAVDMDVTDPGGATVNVPGFFDGDGRWRVRFSPGVVGRWTYRVRSHPDDPGLAGAGSFEATPREDRGFLVATPG